MKKNLAIIMTVVVVAVGASSFYGGLLYGKSRGQTSRFANGQGGNFAERGNFGGQNGSRTGGNMVSGEIIAKDDSSLTVKTSDGGSKIVLFSASTEVGEFTTTTPEILSIGQTVMVSGQSNSDGSVNAQSIQLRSNLGLGSGLGRPSEAD